MKIKHLLIIIAVFFIVACKKNKVAPAPAPAPTPVNPVVPTRQELTKDSIFLYAKQIYLWNDALPSYEIFNPRKYTSGSTDLANYNAVLFDITKYSVPYEYKSGYTSSKYSYIFDKTNKNPSAYIPAVSSVDLEGNGNDIGIRFGYYGSEDKFVIYVAAVYENSPAEKAGFVRGDVINKINGTAYGTDFYGNISAITSAVNATTVTLEGVKSTGANFNVSLTKAVFKSSPIYKTRTITVGTKKVGYLAYARFSNESNSFAALNAAFSDFVANGVTDLIIDLRFNGGGFINTAEHLINLIAPSTANGSVMFAEHYNTLMQNKQATILKNQPLLDENDKQRYGANGVALTYFDVDYSVARNTSIITKVGGLTGVTNVVFIVSNATASASELVINSLKPYMNVKVVGRTTYGKPVGFFPITLENKYDVYFSMFTTKNSLGQGDYYDGLVPDISEPEVPAGTVMYDFGNVNDNYLKKALNIIAPGVTATSQAKVSVLMQKQIALPISNVLYTDLGKDEFKGMIETRHKLK